MTILSINTKNVIESNYLELVWTRYQRLVPVLLIASPNNYQLLGTHRPIKVTTRSSWYIITDL